MGGLRHAPLWLDRLDVLDLLAGDFVNGDTTRGLRGELAKLIDLADLRAARYCLRRRQADSLLDGTRPVYCGIMA